MENYGHEQSDEIFKAVTVRATGNDRSCHKKLFTLHKKSCFYVRCRTNMENYDIDFTVAYAIINISRGLRNK